MLTVTPAALEHMSRKLTRGKADDETSLRFTRNERRWRLRPDRARGDDTVYAHNGRTVLLLDRANCKTLSDLTLDVGDTERGLRLRLYRNPNQGDE
jgi:hypothetical protein